MREPSAPRDHRPEPTPPPEDGRGVADVPRGPVAVPPAVTGLAAGQPVRAVWQNRAGGLTFRIGGGAARRFVKWSPRGAPVDLGAEAVRLRWASAFTPVPDVLAEGADDTGTWLLTAGLPGRSAVDAPFKRDPAAAVRAIGAGLRALHDSLPVDACPFDWSAGRRLAAARARAAAGGIRSADLRPGLQDSGGVESALALLGTVPPADKLVVCHGDACAPNTLVGDDGQCTGHVDLGALGVADRWADLAVATWSTRWNYGPGWEEPLLDAYGIAADPERIRYYRLLWDLLD